MRRLTLTCLCALAATTAEAADAWYTQRWSNEARSGPGTYYGLKATINRGVTVTVLKVQGDWAQFSLPPVTAWMAKSSLAQTPPKDSLFDSVHRLRARLSAPAFNTTAVAAVRGFALRYGRAKASSLDTLGSLQEPFFTPE